MKKHGITVALVIFLALFGIKTLFPEHTARFLSSASELFPRRFDYRQVFSDIGESVFVSDMKESYELPAAPAAKTETARLTESAHNLGEHQLLSSRPTEETDEPQLPEAVSAFLESQAEFSDYDLPDNVSYDFTPFPEQYSTPVAGYNSSGFGYRLHPIHGDVRFHYGTDFAAWTGESILCFADGTVSFAGYCDSYGNYITVDHADGWRSLYAHCSALYVSAGQSVSAGELIALVGDTGLVTGPHLHFELTQNGVYTNPEYYVG